MNTTEASHCRRTSPGALFGRLVAATLALTVATRLLCAPAISMTDKSDYQIEPRDQIKFQVTGEPDEPLVGRVSTAGEISIPLLGAVKVAGLSLRQAEDLMEKRYRAGGFFLNPQVILSFDSYAPRSVSVLGQVNNPSSVDFTIEREQMGIVSAITKAGGFTRVARPDSVKVTRNIDGKDTTFNVNVAAYLNETSSDSEFKLQPDDIVFVPERVF
ncbi:MAG TPA: polysaccharide biosynthesis/export family protein [Opitutaceae bacterium]|nr:polysaccharide biosynthesis/export family protein [Opitutaceae bacterium]